MALEATDVLVVQKQTGNKDNKKLSVQQLSDYLATGPAVNFKGTANMTLSGDEPSSPQPGDLYINSATSSGAFAWTGGTATFTGTVIPNAQAIWVAGTGWAVTNNSGGNLGVEAVGAQLPVEVDSANPSNPIISVKAATTLSSGSNTSGVVQVATDADVAAGTAGTVVTSAQLKTTNEAISNAGGGTVTNVTGTAPIQVDSGTTTPAITIDAAAVGAPGAVALVDDSAVDATSALIAATPKYVADYYLVNDFSSLTDVDA